VYCTSTEFVFKIFIVDAYGNPQASDADQVKAVVKPKQGGVSIVPRLTNMGQGVYIASYNAELINTALEYETNVTLNGAMIHGEPYPTSFVNGTVGPQSILPKERCVEILAGGTCTVCIEMVDNLVVIPSKSFESCLAMCAFPKSATDMSFVKMRQWFERDGVTICGNFTSTKRDTYAQGILYGNTRIESGEVTEVFSGTNQARAIILVFTCVRVCLRESSYSS